MRENHMIGITPAGEADLQLLQQGGIGWLRGGLGISWDVQPSAAYMRQLDKVRRQREMGFQHMAATPAPGSCRYDPASGQTRWMSSVPERAGTPDEDRFYQTVEDACAASASRVAGLISWWQIANEPDIDIFRGPLTDEQLARYLLASARGVKRGNPQARVGINLGFMTDDARKILADTYAMANHPFDYIGIDGYFGSWQKGGPEDWVAYIDEAHQLTGKPVTINEWGYSSLESGVITDDPGRLKRYNQIVCKNKQWNRVWKKEHSPTEQAEYATECLRIFAEHPKVIGNFFFRWGDTKTCWQCGQPDCPAECAWGMTDTAGQPKPVYHAVKAAIARYFPT